MDESESAKLNYSVAINCRTCIFQRRNFSAQTKAHKGYTRYDTNIMH